MKRRPDPPALVLGSDGAPQSLTFGDVYFSKAGGLAESEAVFLAGCGLPAGWRNHRCFAIGELGFGTGLNFLSAWRSWLRTAADRPTGAVLHFVSIEAHPLAQAEAAAALAAFPEVAPEAIALLARWPVRAFGVQRFWFEGGVCLTLHIADAAAALETMTGPIDAWFLDGFAPARNPAMWTPGVFEQVARLSAPGARLATYSTAGAVRRGLEAAGFSVARKPGFAHKRERLEAVLARPVPAPGPWRAPAPVRPRQLAIVGGGIAGASLAAAARRRGLEALVLDAADGPGAGASGNPAALVMPRLDRADTGAARLFLAAYLHALQTYEAMGGGVWSPTGVVEVARDGREAALADLLANPALPDDWLCPAPDGALHARAGVVTPSAAIAALLGDTPVRYNANGVALQRQSDGWRVLDPIGDVLAVADAVVLANGARINSFAQTAHLPIEATLGQIEWGPCEAAIGQPARAGGPYAAPFGDGLVFGATHERCALDAVPTISPAARTANLESLARLAPAWRNGLGDDHLTSRAAIRAGAPDRTPLCGPAPHAEAFAALAAAFARDGRLPDGLVLPRWLGLWLLGGLGGRGFSLSPLLAEALVSDMMGEPSPLDSHAAAAAHPARFLVRALRRNA